MNLKIVLFLLMLVSNRIALAQPAEQSLAKKPATENSWKIQDELKQIKNHLGNTNHTDELNDIAKIQKELSQIEKSLGYADANAMGTQIQEEDSQKSLRQIDDSLNSLKLDELNRIEKTYSYDAWLDYCQKSPDCKKHAAQNQK